MICYASRPGCPVLCLCWYATYQAQRCPTLKRLATAVSWTAGIVLVLERQIALVHSVGQHALLVHFADTDWQGSAAPATYAA